MIKSLRTIAVAVGVVASAGAASAASPRISVLASGLNTPAGQRMIEDFDNPILSGFTYTENTGAFTRSGSLGVETGVSAPPAGDLSNYETITTGGSAVLTSSRLMSGVSVFVGSPDSYNQIEFVGPSYDVTLKGAQLFSPPTDFGGDQSVGMRVNYSFGAALVNKVIFSSAGNSFEYDAVAGSVPEPATWSMLILGLGALGAMLRTRRRAVPTAA
jgi:hypothetical protein